MKISYDWLKWYIPEAPTADKLVDVFNYHLCEVEGVEKHGDDHIFDINILPNRAHDLLSHHGVARELASLLHIQYVDPTPKYKIPPSTSSGQAELKIEIQSDKCRRYMGRIIRNIKVGPSPEWVVKHLESIGQRSINNMVDAANLVMFDCGQPTHVFDLNKVKEKLVVRQAKEGEKLTTLDNKECTLKPTDMVIADTEHALAVAGVKGGKIAEVDNSTTDIILEVANFDPTSIRKTAQVLNIFTDARKRFENDLSPELTPYAMTELSALIFEMCPKGIFEDVVDVYPKKQETRELSFRTEKISKILGLDVSPDEIKDILKRYNIEYTEQGGVFKIAVPLMRLDLEIEEDMAEEIGRILGYDKVKGNIPKIDFKPKQNELYAKILYAKNKLMNDGYSEVMTSSFSMKGEVEVLASASDKNFLRTNLTDGLKESIKLNQTNAPLLGSDQIKIFEIGTIFNKNGSSSVQDSGEIKEEMRVAYADKKEVIEKSLEEFSKNADLNLEPRTYNLEAKFKMWPLYPFIARDVAVWVSENVKSEEVLKVIKENAGDVVIRGPELFDEFKKNGKVSYAFRIVFQSYDRTLTDAEINEVMNKITEKITENNWEVR